MPEILLHDRARKFLERLDTKTRGRIVRALERTAADPHGSPNLSPLRGELSGLHRLRVSDYRVVIEFNDGQNCLYVHAIGPRGDVYK
jgi:mRNA-degrading endonuclease RelE of RelBE toxin-antitoxin system